MSATTPTGIPILPCAQCGHTHPITRTHCAECGSHALFCHPGAARVAAWQTFTPEPKRRPAKPEPTETGRMVRVSADTWVHRESGALT